MASKRKKARIYVAKLDGYSDRRFFVVDGVVVGESGVRRAIHVTCLWESHVKPLMEANGWEITYEGEQ